MKRLDRPQGGRPATSRAGRHSHSPHEKPSPCEIWFVTGSQHLYGEAALRQVAANSQQDRRGTQRHERLPLPLVFKPILTRPEEIRALCLEANAAPDCAGLILWMHTFSPAKMWIGGLLRIDASRSCICTRSSTATCRGPTIDMDFMNLNQAAHGDREAGFICTRGCGCGARWWSATGRIRRCRTASPPGCAWPAPGPTGRAASFVRFGDNMRYVAVTEGDKVAAEAKLGYSVNGHGVGDLVASRQRGRATPR